MHRRNRIVRSATLAVTVANGQEIWFRWQDPDDTGSDHGLAVDDFSVTAGGSPGDGAPAVGATSPANAATNVPVDSTIVINFSESVNATASAFALECPAGAPQPFAQTASPASAFTLTPCGRSSVQHDLHGDGRSAPDLRRRHGRPARRDGRRTSPSRSRRRARRHPWRPTSSSTSWTPTLLARTPRSSSSSTTAAPATRRSTAWWSSSTTAPTTCRTRPSISTDSSTDASGYFTLGNPGVPGVDLVFDPGAAGCCRTARMRSRSSPATPPTFPPARPSRRRIFRTPSSTAPTIRTIRDCWRC